MSSISKDDNENRKTYFQRNFVILFDKTCAHVITESSRMTVIKQPNLTFTISNRLANWYELKKFRIKVSNVSEINVIKYRRKIEANLKRQSKIF